MKFTFSTVILFASSAAAFACSAVTDPDERLACYDARYSEVSLIRCTQAGRHASCDLLTPSADTFASCVVFDASGEPIARNTASGTSGLPLMDMDADNVASIDCEITG